MNRDTPATWITAVAKIGVPTLLVLYLLGAIPGLRSPIDRLEAAIVTHDKNWREQQEVLIRVLRTICRYQVPREAQHECYGPPY